MAEPGERRREAMVGRGQRANYASAENLAKRQSIFAFLDPDRSYGTRPIDRIAWTGREAVLDAGCGNGIWMRTLADRYGVPGVTGLDLSIGMLNDARPIVGPSTGLAAGDVQHLPFPDESFDVVLCFWMLYHVPDHQAALREFRRVLRPGGRVLVTTNRESFQSVGQVVSDAMVEVMGRPVSDWLPPLSFSADNGPDIVAEVFDAVETDTALSTFAFPDADTVLGVLRSSRGPIEVFLGEPVDWDAVERHATRAVNQVISRDGVFRTEMASASFLARK